MIKASLSALFILLFFIVFNINSQVTYGNELIQFSEAFLKYLIAGNAKSIKRMVLKSIKLKLIPEEEINILIENMMRDKISIFKYIIIISGHNIQNFIDNKYDITDFKRLTNIGNGKSLKDDDIEGSYYYIKYELSYKKDQKKVRQSVELDIIKENGFYKIFGFIL